MSGGVKSQLSTVMPIFPTGFPDTSSSFLSPRAVLAVPRDTSRLDFSEPPRQASIKFIAPAPDVRNSRSEFEPFTTCEPFPLPGRGFLLGSVTRRFLGDTCHHTVRRHERVCT